MTRRALVVRWFWSTAAVAGMLAWLHILGSGDLAAPTPTINGLRTWFDRTDSVIAVFVVVRLVAMLLGWYLLVVFALGTIGRWLELPAMTSLLDRLTLPCARGVFGGVALLGVMASGPTQPRLHDAMVEVTAAPSDDQVTLHLVDDQPPASAPTPESAPPPSLQQAGNSWVVEPGDCLWSIATAHLVDIRGEPVTEREVAQYWRQVIDANRSRLADPADPDLLYAGDVVELPPVG